MQYGSIDLDIKLSSSQFICDVPNCMRVCEYGTSEHEFRDVIQCDRAARLVFAFDMLHALVIELFIRFVIYESTCKDRFAQIVDSEHGTLIVCNVKYQEHERTSHLRTYIVVVLIECFKRLEHHFSCQLDGAFFVDYEVHVVAYVLIVRTGHAEFLADGLELLCDRWFDVVCHKHTDRNAARVCDSHGGAKTIFSSEFIVGRRSVHDKECERNNCGSDHQNGLL